MLRLFSSKNFGPYHVLALATLGSLTQWIHLLADYQWGEEEPLLLFWSAFAITSLTKMAMFIAFPFMLAQAFATMQGNLRRCAIFTNYWAIALGSVVILLTVFRDPLCLLFSTDAARFYPVSNNYLGSYTELASWVGREAWLPRWRSGEVFLWESVLMAVIVASWGLLGYKTTAWFKPLTEALLACALPPLLLAPYLFITQLSAWDYDFFFGSIFSDALVIEITFPFIASDICSPIVFALAAVFSMATALALRAVGKIAEPPPPTSPPPPPPESAETQQKVR